MAKYIDAEKLKAEIDKKWRELADKNVKVGGGKYDIEIYTYLSIKNLITSLQDEQPEVDLEKEIETSIRLLNGLHTLEDNKRWYKGRYEELKEFARHFYELDKNSK